ncbi:MAG TPA: transcription antitermination factor NusB [Syntrophomonadaceae bacterium]|nr:transcription antitermination factor NusB [Syntrophomonadaceae bacterium]
MSRRKAREMAFKVLFQVDQVGADPQRAFRYLQAEGSMAEKDREFSWDLVQGCLSDLTRIDTGLARYSRDWSLDRMSSVDRNIMRLAAFEIIHTDRSQAVVAIDEAIEIAKKYGDEGSASFVNAILDKILGEKE